MREYVFSMWALKLATYEVVRMVLRYFMGAGAWVLWLG
jgi:hypothetical protein